MPVEFLTDAQAATFGHYAGPPSTAEMDRFFLLDDKALGVDRAEAAAADPAWASRCRSRRLLFLGTFLADPTDVPSEVVDYLAEQLSIEDPSCVKAYRVREMTRLEHAREIRDAYGFGEFTDVEQELVRADDELRGAVER